METDLSEVQRLGLAREAAAIAVSARDRGQRFRPAAARALPNVTQDADLRHLTENVSHALALCGSPIHAPGPRRDRLGQHQSRLADRRRAHPV